MPMPRSIEVTISPKADTKIEAKGFEGVGCLKATENLEQALGKVKKRTNKSEMLKNPEIGERVKVGK